ncbi:D-aminoacyl-tRNA deacylase [bacterium HR20]|uniref:D-aminoacyl-tRNA deacylase n=1 Tax=uncultured Bacteroidota bacterium TaxID=152509 RepID=H5SBM0_9BACT|nr:D-tyrosyl-tRNA(Tyr) deacylase [uncultured Bacteroidetes bacterium]GBD05577.1 D-aminoacyl-tRNA deacylase [bacterium HR20]
MRAVVQRVHRASVRVDGATVSSIECGLLVYLGIHRNDSEETVQWIARKIAGLRIFPDGDGRFNRSVREVGGAILVVSQFTLYGDTAHGFRPSFSEAASPELAEPLYERVIALLRSEHSLPVATGIFGAMMEVESINWGPVTILLEK